MPISPRARARLARLALVGLAAGFVGLLLSTCGPFRSVSGRAVSAAEANSRLWHGHVPEDATDVWFTSGYRGTQVECTLTPESFRAWCEYRGWSPFPIGEGEPVYKYSERDGVVTISRGLRFCDMEGDVGHSGLYDEATGRAYVTYSGG